MKSGNTHRAGPDLRVGGQLERSTADVEEQALEVGELRRGDLQKTRVFVVKDGTRQLLVCGESIWHMASDQSRKGESCFAYRKRAR